MIRTPHYKFPYFSDGELFSAYLDQERAIAIDLLLKGLSTITDDGIIDGWDISDAGGLNISVSPGKGIISGFYGVTQNAIEKTLSDDSTNYIYASRNSNISDSVSTSSNKIQVDFLDLDPPDAPSLLAVSSVGDRVIELQWNKSTNTDIDHYKVYRKTSVEISYTFISDVSHLYADGLAVVLYEDTGLSPETIYNYRVSAVDLSGNESSFSSITQETDMDTTPASEVTNFRLLAAKESVSLTWNASSSEDLDSYIVVLSELDSAGNVSSSVSLNVGTNLYYFTNSLTNNVSYKATIKTLDTSGNVSVGIGKEFTPRWNAAPDEVSVFGYTVTNAMSPEPVTPSLELSWNASLSANVSHYNLYIYDNGVESERILVGNNTSKTLISYPYRSGQSLVAKIFNDSSDYEIRLTAVNTDGIESQGILIKASIPDYSAPPELKNIVASSGDGNVSFVWEAADVSDFAHYEVYSWEADSESSFSETAEYSSFAGSTFTLANPVSGTYPVGSWVELTNAPSGGGTSVKLSLAMALNPGDSAVVCDYIPTYYDQTSDIKITNPPAPSIVSQREFYRISGLTNDVVYRFVFRTVDAVGNKSYGVSLSGTPSETIYDLTSPASISIKARDRELSISWTQSFFAEGYKVYRAGPFDIYTYRAQETDFSLIATVEGISNTSIFDIGLENNKRYAYLVTSYVGASESDLNIAIQEVGIPMEMGLTEPPENLLGIVASGEVALSWEPPSDITGIEGWNVYRNTSEYGTFELVASVPFTSLSYVDTGLIDGQEYYYVVRSFSNTVDINTSISETIPALSIRIGTVVTQSGSIYSITPERTIIASLQSTVENLTNDFIKNHKHSATVDEEFSDTRKEALQINLSSEDDVVVFETSDYQNYVSERDLIEHDSYVVYINDEIPNLLYEVDFDSNTIVFEKRLYSASGSSLYDSPPVIRLQFVNLKEISGQLNSAFIGDLNASQIVSGLLAKAILPLISHRGRIKELASVRKYVLLSNDNSYFDLDNITYETGGVETTLSLGTSTLFYDFYEYGGVLYGASSKSILKSLDSGVSWSSHVVIDDTIREFYQKQNGGNILYFAIGRRKIYFTTNGSTWFAMSGLDAVGMIHGLAEDDNGNVYLASDTGVYVYDLDYASQHKFTAASIITFGSTSSEILSVINTGEDGILVSTSEGTFNTQDKGATWTQYSSVNSLYKLQRWSGTKIIAIDDSGYCYETENDGITWTTNLQLSSIDRNDIFEVIDGRLFFSTAEGLFYTDDLNSVVEIQGGFKKRWSKSSVRCVYGSLKNNVVLSFDNRLYRWKNGKTTLWSEFLGTIPSVFSNGTICRNGYYYNINRNDLYFEWKKSYDEIDTIAVDYLEYSLSGGGWQDIDASDVEISMYVNGEYLGTVSSEDLSSDYIDADATTGEITNKRYEFAYLGQTKLTVYSNTGKIYISGSALSKFDIIHVTIANATFTNEGTISHYDIDDALSKKDTGLPFGLANAFLDGLLQMGLFAEHNFVESIQTDTQYPYASTRIVKSFNSELINSDHFIFCKKFYDVFNSSIDYVEVLKNKTIDTSPFIIKGIYEIDDETWAASDRNMFVLSADRTSISREIAPSSSDLDITSIAKIGDLIYIIGSNGIYSSDDGGETWVENARYGLPKEISHISSVFNMRIVGGLDGIYYSSMESNTWKKANFYDSSSNLLAISGRVSSLAVFGAAVCLIDNTIYKSFNGITWKSMFSFDSLDISGLVASGLFPFNNTLFVLTDNGLYSDFGSLNNASENVAFTRIVMDSQDVSASAKSISLADGNIMVVSGKNTIYRSEDSGTTWTKQTVSSVDFVDVCHVWRRIKITDEGLDSMGANGVPLTVLAKLSPIKDVVYDSLADLNGVMASLLTAVEYNNYSSLIGDYVRVKESDTEIISSLADCYSRQLDLSFAYADSIARADRVYGDSLKQPADGSVMFEKISLYLTPSHYPSSDYSITLSLYGADGSNNIITGILSSDIKSSAELYGPGWYNFRIYYVGGYERVMLVLTQNYGDNNSTSKWSYIVNDSMHGAINNSGTKDYSYNFIAWQYEDSCDGDNQRLLSDPAEELNFTPSIGDGNFYQTKYEDSKVKLSLEPKVLSFLVDQSGSLTWNDHDGSRFDLIRQFATDLNNLYPGTLYYVLASYGSKIIDTLSTERITDDTDSIYGGNYRIVRRTNDYPATPLDGTIIATTGLAVASDDSVFDGGTYYYSIFNMRSDDVYSLSEKEKITVHSRSIPLPVSGLSLEEVVVKETIGIPAAEIDTGKRQVVIRFKTIQNYSAYYDSVRIVRKECYQDAELLDDSLSNAPAKNPDKHVIEDDTIRSPFDGTLVYEGIVSSGENIVIDDFAGSYKPINGIKYYYAIYTKNSLGNYCLPQNAQQTSLRISSVWRSWMFDSSYVPSQIPSEFLVSPSDVEDFSIEAGNTQNRISWTIPSGDTAIGVMVFASDTETPNPDSLKIAHYDATGTSGSATSTADSSSSGTAYKAGNLVYQGTGNYFVHRELENSRRYYYRVYTFDRVRTMSAGKTIGQAVPLSSIVDDFEPPAAKNFHAEIFNSKKIILKWQKDVYYKEVSDYFEASVALRSYAYDDEGIPVPEISDFDFTVSKAYLIPKSVLEFDGGSQSSETSAIDMSSNDYTMTIDNTSYDGEIRAAIQLRKANNPNVLSGYLQADFEIFSQYDVYSDELLSQNETEVTTTAEEAGVDTSLYEDGMVSATTDSALEFTLESLPVVFTLKNPLVVGISNKYPETQKVAQKEKADDGLGGTKTIVVYYDGVYAKSGMSYYGDIVVSFKDTYLNDSDSVSVSAKVYELESKTAVTGGGYKRVWKQTPSTIFELEENSISLSNVSRKMQVLDESGNTTSDTETIVSLGTFRLLPPQQATELNILVTTVINGYVDRTEHIIMIKTMLNVDLEARAPVADGRDVAEEFAQVYVGPPLYDEKSSLLRTPVTDGTLVKWELEKGRYGEDRSFYSAESVPLQDGVYSVVKNGVARNIFFGPASDVKKHYVQTENGVEIVGEEYVLKASSVYSGMFGYAEEDLAIDPLEVTGSSYRFYMTNGYEMAGQTIYADGYTPTDFQVHADPLITGGDSGQTFYDCLEIGDMPHITLLEGQGIQLQNPDLGSIDTEKSEIIYTYDSVEYSDPESVPIVIESGLALFSATINAFIGPPPKKKEDTTEEEPKIAKCYLYGLVPQETSYPPLVSFSGQSQMIFGGKSITLFGGGSRTTGIPPVVVTLKEPLNVSFQKLMSAESVVVNPPNDGINSTDIYFEITFSGEAVPDGTPITFEFVFSDGDKEYTLTDLAAMSEADRKILLSGFSSYEEFVSEIQLNSYKAITSTVSGKSVAYCTLSPTKIKGNASLVLRATSTYDKKGTVEREMYGDVTLKFIGSTDGAGASSVYLKKVERYDTVADSWDEIDPLIVGRVAPVSEYDSSTEKMFVIGGLTEDGLASTGEVFSYDRVDKSALEGSYGTWSYISDMTYARAFAQSVIYNGKIYVLGGFGLDPFSGQSGLNSNVLCEEYDIASDTWSVLESMPYPVSHGCAELIGDNIYVFSGISSLKENDKGHTIDIFNNHIMKYNVTSGTWSTIAELDEVSNVLKRVSASSFTDSGMLYISGGIQSEYDDKNYEDAVFVNTLVEIDVTDEENIVYAEIAYTNTPIQRFRAGAYGILGNKFYVAGGSGIKQHVDGSVTVTTHSNTLRALESYDVTTQTWTTYKNLSRMTYERHSPGAFDDAEYFYVAGGAGSGYEPGKLLINVTLDPDKMRADGKTQVSASIELVDTTGEPPEDGIKMTARGYVLVSVPAEGSDTAAIQDTTSTSGAVDEISQKVSVYPVLFSSLTLYCEDGAAGTILLERSEDIMVALKDLAQYMSGDDSVVGIVYDEDTKKIKVPQKTPYKMELGSTRDLYNIIVEITIEDDFYFGATDTEGAVASNASALLQEQTTGLKPGQMIDSTTGEIVDDPDYVAPGESSGGSLTVPEAAEQDESPTLPVYSDITWIPAVNDTYDIMTFAEFSDELDVMSQKIPFGGSPHWDGLVRICQNVLKQNEILTIGKIMVDVSDNEENLSSNSLDDAIAQVQLVDGYQKLPVFSNAFVTSFPPSLSARKGQSDVVDLEKLSGETLGLSHTVSDSSYVNPIVRKIKIGSVGAMGRGTYTQIVDFAQNVHVISLKGTFELYDFTNGWIEIYGSLDGYNYDALGIIFEADMDTEVNLSLRYLKFVVTLSSEFGDASLLIPSPAPAFLGIEFVYSEPKTQYVYTYAYDIGSYIREIYMTMNGIVPSTSDVKLGYTSSNSTIWDDYQKSAQPAVSQNGRIVSANSTMSLLNLVDSSTEGGKTSATYKTYEEITEEFKIEKQDEYGKIIENVIIIEYATSTTSGSSKLVFSDGTSITIDEAPDYSNAIDFASIDGSDPTKEVTNGTVLNYDFIYSKDGYLFVSRYGRWQPEAAINVYRNGVLVDPIEYMLIRSEGIVKFFDQQRLTSNYAIEVGLSPKYRIGLAVTNMDSTNYAILDEFAYVYNTNFIKTKDYNNSVPTASDLYVTPLKALKTSEFKANYTYRDGNNDAESNSEIQWYINGGIVPELKDLVSWTASDLFKNTLKDGDRIFFTVRPSDGKIYGALSTSSTVYLGDTPPSISGLGFVYLYNGVVYNSPSSNVDIIVTYTYYDGQGRAESGTTFEWFVNGVSLPYDGADQSILRNNVLDADGNLVISKGNIIKVRVIPSNGIIKGIAYETGDIVVLNSAPSVTNVYLTPLSPDSNSVLTLTYAYYDRDGDSDSTEIRWFKNGEAMTVLNDYAQVNASYLESGDSWYAELTPYDGESRGIKVRTSTLTIS